MITGLSRHQKDGNLTEIEEKCGLIGQISGVSGLRVLIVDDHPDVRSMIRMVLADLPNIEIAEEQQGEVALKRLEESRYDLLIADINMPGMDGVTLVEKAQEIRPTKFIIITGEGMKAIFRAAKSLGTGEYLAKPFTRDILLETVDTVMKAA